VACRVRSGPDEVRSWQRRGKPATLSWLVAARGAPRYRGRAPLTDGFPLDPVNEFGHDKLLWLDQMVLTSQPLREKMTLFWHDHFATNRQPTPLMLAQNETMRPRCARDVPRPAACDDARPGPGPLAVAHEIGRRSAERELRARADELFTLGSG
jgi:hypothetical protein